MQRLIDPNKGLPSGWPYVFPETGFEIKASNFNALIQKAMKHAIGNQLDTETLVARIEDYLCRNTEPGYCVEEGSPLLPQSTIAIVAPCGGCKGKASK